jgi:hypothetical protein
MANTAPTTFEDWLKDFQNFLSDKLTTMLRGIYGPWFRGYFDGDTELFKKLDGTAHGNYYVQNRAGTAVPDNYLSVPLQKMRADELMALERDIRMMSGNRLSFYRSRMTRLRLLNFHFDVVKNRLNNLDKMGNKGS